MAYGYRPSSTSNGLRSSRTTNILRPLSRLILTGRVRFIIFLVLLVSVVVFSIRTLTVGTNGPLSSSSSLNSLSPLDFQDRLPAIKDSLSYAVMIDAGSSGSRVQIYVWAPHSGDPRELLNIRFLKDSLGKDVFMKINPGLSSTAANPSSASDYIRPLLDFAAKNVPKQKHKETPLYILATAGMRMLDPDTQLKILSDLRNDIPANYAFLFDTHHVQVISGKEEGIFSWISLNYMTRRFDHRMTPRNPIPINLEGKKMTTRERTIGMIEMGGASTQIAFEINDKNDLEEIRRRQGVASLKDMEDTLFELNLGCDSHDEDHTYLLYVKTFLGLGANAVRKSYLRQLASVVGQTVTPQPSGVVQSPKPLHTSLSTGNDSINKSITDNSNLNGMSVIKDSILLDPCLNKGAKEIYDASPIVMVTNSSKKTAIYREVLGTGDFDSCRSLLKTYLETKREEGPTCKTTATTSKITGKNCPLTDLSRTRIAFENTEFYGFSEFFYSVHDMLRLGGQYDYQKVSDEVKKECSLDFTTLESRYNNQLYPRVDRERLIHQCFKSSWLLTFLHDGLMMPKTYKSFKTVMEIDGDTVQWTLGALLFKTRFFPLRDKMTDNDKVHKNGHFIDVHLTPSPSSSTTTYILFFGCMAVVLVSIVVYLRHLQQMTLPVVMPSSSALSTLSSSSSKGLLNKPEDEQPLVEVSVT